MAVRVQAHVWRYQDRMCHKKQHDGWYQFYRSGCHCFDLNGYMILQKWFDDGKLMKPKFMEMKRFHHITREQAMFLLSNAVQSEIYIYDKENDDQRAV